MAYRRRFCPNSPHRKKNNPWRDFNYNVRKRVKEILDEIAAKNCSGIPNDVYVDPQSPPGYHWFYFAHHKFEVRCDQKERVVFVENWKFVPTAQIKALAVSTGMTGLARRI